MMNGGKSVSHKFHVIKKNLDGKAPEVSHNSNLLQDDNKINHR